MAMAVHFATAPTKGLAFTKQALAASPPIPCRSSWRWKAR